MAFKEHDDTLTRRAVMDILYVMQTKLTLRIDEELVHQAKTEARQRGKSVSQMFGEFINALSSQRRVKQSYPPVTSSLLGILKDQRPSESDYKKHLEKKYL